MYETFCGNSAQIVHGKSSRRFCAKIACQRSNRFSNVNFIQNYTVEICIINSKLLFAQFSFRVCANMSHNLFGHAFAKFECKIGRNFAKIGCLWKLQLKILYFCKTKVLDKKQVDRTMCSVVCLDSTFKLFSPQK